MNESKYQNLPPDQLSKLTRDLNGASKKKKVFREYVEAFVTAVVLAFIIRSFVFEPYKIPSKSMVPTLLVGDHIFVNKFAYGLRIPGTMRWITKFRNPRRGEVVVFIYPVDESLDFIKRVVGLPGDELRMVAGKLYVNGSPVEVQPLQVSGVDPNDKGALLIPEAKAHSVGRVAYYREYKNYQIEVETLGDRHLVQHSLLFPSTDDFDIVVPPDHFFVMGDNRDQSADSRVWGFVPRENLKGSAMFIWLSLDSDLGGIRLKRFGKLIK